MPRLPPHSPRTRRDEILDEATRLFAERGYEGASMADLADSVGMRKASLFYHFASKEVLYGAVIDRLLKSFGQAVADAHVMEGSFEERLDALTECIVGVFGAQPFAGRLLVREIMDWGPVVRATLADSIILLLTSVEDFLKAGQTAGVFVAVDPKETILTLVGIHILPFALASLTERLVGKPTSDPAFVANRLAAVRAQVRALLLVNRS